MKKFNEKEIMKMEVGPNLFVKLEYPAEKKAIGLSLSTDGRFSTVGAICAASELFDRLRRTKMNANEAFRRLEIAEFTNFRIEAMDFINADADAGDIVSVIMSGDCSGDYVAKVFDMYWSKEAESRMKEHDGIDLGRSPYVHGSMFHVREDIQDIQVHENDALEGDGFFPYSFYRREKDR